MADFIKLKTFLEENILGVKLMILDLKKTKIFFFSPPLTVCSCFNLSPLMGCSKKKG